MTKPNPPKNQTGLGELPAGMRRIDLALCDGQFLALLVPAKTGVLWTNQTSGHACQHPEIEGYLVPLDSSGLTLPRPEGFENVGFGFEAYDPKLVERFLLDNRLDIWFEPLETKGHGLSREHGMQEAWLWVRVRDVELPVEARREVLLGLRGVAGILTWPNSD